VDNVVFADNKDSWKLVEKEVKNLHFKADISKIVVVILVISSLLLYEYHSFFKTHSGPWSLLNIMDQINSLLMRDSETNEYSGRNIGG
jgi:hypothetical protein